MTPRSRLWASNAASDSDFRPKSSDVRPIPVEICASSPPDFGQLCSTLNRPSPGLAPQTCVRSHDGGQARSHDGGRIRHTSALRTPATNLFAICSKSLASATSGAKVSAGRLRNARALIICNGMRLTVDAATTGVAGFASEGGCLRQFAPPARARAHRLQSGDQLLCQWPPQRLRSTWSRASRGLTTVEQSSSTACVPSAATNTEMMPCTVWPWKAPSGGCGSAIVARPTQAASPLSGIEVECGVFRNCANTCAR